MIIVKCVACGWTGCLSKCDNGEHESPTCYTCKSGHLRVINNKFIGDCDNIDNDVPIED